MKYRGVQFTFYLLLLLQVNINLNCSFAEQPTSLRNIDLSKFQVADDIPTSWMLAHTPYKSGQIINERKDIPEEIAGEERLYMWPWCAKLFSRDLGGRLEPTDIFFISGVGEHDDDAGVLKWSYNRFHKGFDPEYNPSDTYDIELIDSRMITYLVRHEKFPEMNILDIFKEVVYYYGSFKNDSKIQIIETHKLSDNSLFGKISVKKPNTGWFCRPIEWYKKGDFVLFVFEKIVDMPSMKGFPDIDNFDRKDELVGGIPFYDKRSYLRFENANRKQLIEDYFEDYYFEEAEKHTKRFIDSYRPGEPQGVPPPILIHGDNTPNPK